MLPNCGDLILPLEGKREKWIRKMSEVRQSLVRAWKDEETFARWQEEGKTLQAEKVPCCDNGHAIVSAQGSR